METLGDFADKYIAPVKKVRKCITELELVRVDTPVVKNVVKEGTPEEFTVYEMEIDEVTYRVPVSVIAQIKGIKAIRNDCAAVKVTKSGTGMGTSYQVIAL